MNPDGKTCVTWEEGRISTREQVTASSGMLRNFFCIIRSLKQTSPQCVIHSALKACFLIYENCKRNPRCTLKKVERISGCPEHNVKSREKLGTEIVKKTRIKVGKQKEQVGQKTVNMKQFKFEVLSLRRCIICGKFAALIFSAKFTEFRY